MNFLEFKRILSTFADSPLDIDISKGKLLVQVNDALIEGTVTQESEGLFVTENGIRLSATRWIVERVARVPLLADRILAHIAPEPSFVVPSGTLLDQPDFVPTGNELQTESDSLVACRKVLGRRPAGTTSILYVTSDAGEGKTTLINQLARELASDYKSKKSDWLLLPVSLGGRPFMRFDEVIIAALANRFRFQTLYFDSLLELIKLGIVVPALDGFEEMFVERASGDAASSLGNLVQMLNSSGSVLIAARKAYFDYSNLAASSRLFDALGTNAVTFSKLSLSRWSKNQFLEYSAKRSIANAGAIYSDVSGRLGESHPLLTRAVLVRRLVDVAASVTDRNAFLAKIDAEPAQYFSQFVETIIEREAGEKWINKSGEPTGPLITVNEHYELLSMLAQELWDAGRSAIGGDILDTVARLFCEKRTKTVEESRQIVEHFKRHALLSLEDSGKQLFAFDHEEFFHYFLGEALGNVLLEAVDADVRLIMRPRALPSLSLEIAVARCRGRDTAGLVSRVMSVCQSDDPTSFARENAGGLIIGILNAASHPPITIRELSFPHDSLENPRLSSVAFDRCYFQTTRLSAFVSNCTFAECDFERLIIDPGLLPTSTTISASRIHALQVVGLDATIYDPNQIEARLRLLKLSPTSSSALTKADATAPDDDLILTERALRMFLRSTKISDMYLQNKLGKNSARFINEILPRLVKEGILRDADYHGASKLQYFRLNVPMNEINSILRSSDGKFEEFLKVAKQHTAS